MAVASVDVQVTPADLARELRADVAAGLTATPKTLPPKWFYDAAGSKLFERITALPEYFPTRVERELLRRHAGEIAELSRADTLIELGSGSSSKTRLLLTALSADGLLKTYVPQDVSETALRGAAEELAADFPGLAVRGIVGDFTGTLDTLPTAGHRMIAFLGGTIGNFTPALRQKFWGSLGAALRPGEHALIGAGLVIDPATLIAAYDDAAGVTAEFNRNVLRVINGELGGDFRPECFDHVALWDSAHSRIEMRLRARKAMAVRVADLGLDVRLAAGEEIHTEISAKFTVEGLEAELTASGMVPQRSWVDGDRRFLLVLARRG